MVLNKPNPNSFRDLIGVLNALPKDINVLPIPFASSPISTNGGFNTINNSIQLHNKITS